VSLGEALLDDPVTSLLTLPHVTDHLGSTRAVLDAAGTVVEARDYYLLPLRLKDARTQRDAGHGEGRGLHRA
jgi:hypothetical protein